MKRRLFLLLAAICFLCGCSKGDSGGAMSAIQETNVFSLIKAVSTMQFVHWTDRGEFAATLLKLQQADYMNQNVAKIVAAQQAGKPLHGYFFKDLVRDESGSSIDSRMRYGLSAVPEKPGSGASFLLLIDPSTIKIDEDRGRATETGVEYYKTATKQNPVEIWPGPSTLAGWERIVLRTPQEGLKAAQELIRK